MELRSSMERLTEGEAGATTPGSSSASSFQSL